MKIIAGNGKVFSFPVVQVGTYWDFQVSDCLGLGIQALII
jgi:hypothetical protein